jgi:hypothetical protein
MIKVETVLGTDYFEFERKINDAISRLENSGHKIISGSVSSSCALPI